ncbi:hypothetical protein KCP70_17790 [Salmonella enterica subsp. enterica]|nr:hypothetical protein KCP70_17790 [Salmonella enterica subsp. enterica]
MRAQSITIVKSLAREPVTAKRLPPGTNPGTGGLSLFNQRLSTSGRVSGVRREAKTGID